MYLNSIFAEAKTLAKPVRLITDWSNVPGIYFIFLNCERFPLKLKGSRPILLYIGKTLISSASRDRDTHFKTGRTGSSTFRRIIGALLREELKLKPVPRSKSDIKKGRFHFYSFDDFGDEELTKWMMNNLSISFYPYLKSPTEIEVLETSFIRDFIPPLNTTRNPSNPHLRQLREARRICSRLAYESHDK